MAAACKRRGPKISNIKQGIHSSKNAVKHFSCTKKENALNTQLNTFFPRHAILYYKKTSLHFKRDYGFDLTVIVGRLHFIFRRSAFVH